MKRRIQLVTLSFLVVVSGLVGLGLYFSKPPSDAAEAAPIEIAIASTESLRVGDPWRIALVASNMTDEDIRVHQPRLGLESVTLNIAYRSPGTGRENEPEEFVQLRRVHPEGSVTLETLAGKKSAEYELIRFPAVRAGTYILTASYKWTSDRDEVTTENEKEVIVMPGDIGGEKVNDLHLIVHTKSEDGQAAALRFETLHATGLATAIHVAALAGGEKSVYAGSYLGSRKVGDATLLGFGLDENGKDELPYALFGNPADSEAIAKEEYLAGLVHDADNPHSGEAVFEVVLGKPGETFFENHLPFARLVGGHQRVDDLAAREAEEGTALLKPRVKIEKIEFEPRATDGDG